MNSLERVRLCLAHTEPDRVPIDFGGWLCGIKQSAWRRLADHLGIEPAAWRSYTPPAPVLERFGVDFRRITPRTPAREKPLTNADGSVTDRWGITRIYEAEDDQIVRFPLAHADIEELDRRGWPDASPEGRYEGLADAARQIHAAGFAVVAQPDISGVFELSCWLCGFDRMLADMALDAGFVHALFEKICRLQEQYAHNYYSAAGADIDIVQLGDDLGTQNAPFFSPRMYREMVMPYQMRYHRAIRRHTAAHIFHHSCGSVYRLLEGLVESGVEILNPVQVSAAEMAPARLKKEFGDVLVFHGGIDVQTVLPFKKPQEVRDEVKRMLDILAPGGGYILAPSHNIQGDTPAENVVAMFEAALEYGRYR